MKALIPTYGHLIGYIVIALAVVAPVAMYFMGRVNDGNLLFYRQCTNLLVMLGALMIVFAQAKDESAETEKIRANAMRNAMFLTVLLMFLTMLYRLKIHDFQWMGSSSFVVFLLICVLCVEFGIHKNRIDKMFKRKQ